MRPANEYTEARMLLAALLKQHGDGVVQLPSEWTEREREFMMATTAHTVMLYHIAYMAGFDAVKALEGVAAISAHTRKQLFEICDETEELTDEEAEAIEEAEDPRGFYEK